MSRLIKLAYLGEPLSNSQLNRGCRHFAWLRIMVVVFAFQFVGCDHSIESQHDDALLQKPTRRRIEEQFAESKPALPSALHKGVDGRETAPESTNSQRQQEHPPFRPQRLTVATYNINYGNVDLPAVRQNIEQADADIVCLQEVNRESATYLREQLFHAYSNARFNGSVRPYLAGGFGVLSKLPIESERFLRRKHGLFGTQIVEVRVADQVVCVCNVHLQPVMLRRGGTGSSLLRALSAFREAERTHGHEVKRIMRELPTDMPVIVAGDFNSLQSGQAPRTLKNAGFVDSFAATNKEPARHPTWHWPTRLGEVSFRIDYLFHGPALKTNSSRVIRAAGSDHFVLRSELEFASTTRAQ